MSVELKSRHLARIVSGLLAAALVFISLASCSSLGTGGERREFVIENPWVRSTTSKEFLGFRRMNRMSPIVLENVVIQANAIDGISAYQRKSGIEVWRLNLANGVEGGAQVSGDRLYFGSSDGQFYCVSAVNGKTLWTFPVRAETLAAPTIDNGIVYFESGTDVVYALDAATGKQLWLYNRQVTGSLSIRATTRPVVTGESLLVGFSDGFLVSLKKRDGSLQWERKLGRANRFRDVDSTPVVEGANVYVSSFDAALYSLKAESGEINWTVEDGGYVPVTLGRDRFSDRLFYATAGGKLLAIDKSTGKILTSIPVQRGIATQPAYYKGSVVYGESEGKLIVADAGSLRAIGQFEPGQGLVSMPAVSEQTGEVFFISNNANLWALKFAYRRTSERLPWRKTL